MCYTGARHMLPEDNGSSHEDYDQKEHGKTYPGSLGGDDHEGSPFLPSKEINKHFKTLLMLFIIIEANCLKVKEIGVFADIWR